MANTYCENKSNKPVITKYDPSKNYVVQMVESLASIDYPNENHIYVTESTGEKYIYYNGAFSKFEYSDAEEYDVPSMMRLEKYGDDYRATFKTTTDTSSYVLYDSDVGKGFSYIYELDYFDDETETTTTNVKFIFIGGDPYIIENGMNFLRQWVGFDLYVKISTSTPPVRINANSFYTMLLTAPSGISFYVINEYGDESKVESMSFKNLWFGNLANDLPRAQGVLAIGSDGVSLTFINLTSQNVDLNNGTRVATWSATQEERSF